MKKTKKNENNNLLNKMKIITYSILIFILLALNCGGSDSDSDCTKCKSCKTSIPQTSEEITVADLDILAITYAEDDTIDSVTQNIILNSSGEYGSTITWESKFPQIIKNNGTVKRPDFLNIDATVKLIATASRGNKRNTEEFILTVIKADPTDAEAVTADLGNDIITYIEGDSINSVTQNITFSNIGENGSVITWVSDTTSIIEGDGTIIRPAFIDGVDIVVKITATATKGIESDTKTFTITVIRKPPNNAEAVADTIANSTFITYAAIDTIDSVTKNITLAADGTYGTKIIWESNETEFITTGGGITRPIFGIGIGNLIVKLTATISRNNVSDTKEFNLTVMEVNVNPETGYVVSLNIGDVPFKMMYVEGGLEYKAGLNDTIITSVANPFFIAETELTYGLWGEVGNWAFDHGYKFSSGGQKGSNDAPKTKQQPATTMNWRDAIVWTNALTEYHNETYNTNLQPIFYSDDSYTILQKDSTDDTCGGGSVGTTPGDCDNPYIYAGTNGNLDILNSTANGYRLLTIAEHELAGRYQGDDDRYDPYSWPIFANWWTKGQWASGANAAGAIATELVAVCEASSTAEVKSKLPNVLGLYDMGGNITEWVFDKKPTKKRVMRGSIFAANCNKNKLATNSMTQFPYFRSNALGFRIARSSK
jgi:hypothetical protein